MYTEYKSLGLYICPIVICISNKMFIDMSLHLSMNIWDHCFPTGDAVGTIFELNDTY